MMNKNLYRNITSCFCILVAAILFTACQKENTNLPDTSNEPPLVKIIKPTQPEYYRSGENICVVANASSQNQLSRVVLTILKAETEQICSRIDYPVNGNTFLLDTEIPVTSAMRGNCALQIEARDVYGNRAIARQSISAE